MAHIKKNDQVEIMTGKDKGKRGPVIQILTEQNKVMVKGACIKIKHAKAGKRGEIAGIKKEEGFISLSNVMPVCSACNKPCRVEAKIIENNKKVRACHRCQAAL